jgi:hypothetical protein
VFGRIFVFLLVWISLVRVVDGISGYESTSYALISGLSALALIGGGLSGLWRAKVRRRTGEGVRSALDRMVEILRPVGMGIVTLSIVSQVAVCLVGFGIALNVVSHLFGDWLGLLIGVVLAPATYGLAPLYAGVRLGNWFPAFVCYGGPLSMILLRSFGLLIAAEAPESQPEHGVAPDGQCASPTSSA